MDLTYKQPYCDCEQFNCDNSVNSIKNFNAINNLNRTQVVCGNDNVTYKNTCELKKAACWRQKRIDIIHYSACPNRNSDKKSIHPNLKVSNDVIKSKLN